MDYSGFIRSLIRQFDQPLPGREAQLKMTSLARFRMLTRFSPDPDARQSSVLILLYPEAGKTMTVVIRRPEYDGIHSGQISLPGGKHEDGDESLVYTALREAREEIGIDPARVQIIGRLTELYIPPSNFLVTPVVGYLTSGPVFTADPKEVARIIGIRLDDLLDPGNIRKKRIKIRAGITFKVPSFFIDGTIIWGATAMILNEFREIVLKAIEIDGKDGEGGVIS